MDNCWIRHSRCCILFNSVDKGGGDGWGEVRTHQARRQDPSWGGGGLGVGVRVGSEDTNL